jgi:hypothetical protein
MTHLFRALVTYISKYAPTPMPEPVMRRLTVHCVVQLFGAMDTSEGEGPAWTTLQIEKEFGK